jgi:hypothetical protein
MTGLPNTSILHLARWLAVASANLAGTIAMAWAAGALYFDLPAPAWLRNAAALAWFVSAAGAWWLVRPHWCAHLAVALVFFGILGWWLSLAPQRERDWKPAVARLPSAVIAGAQVTICNVRNFEYRTETAFTPHYETRHYTLDQLRGMDAILTYWGSPFMAHPIISFDFGAQGRIAFSIETRPERGEQYSTPAGLYRQYELIVIAADERDVVRLRTNFRTGETSYLYHLTTPPARARSLFLVYLRLINELDARPQWYNAITHNCTTSIRTQRTVAERAPWDWRMLVNGYADQLLYDRGGLDRSLPFAELKRRACINARAQAANAAPDFSARIRAQ